MKYFPLDSFVNFNLKVPGYIFKDEYEGNWVIEFASWKPKIDCIVDEKDPIHNASEVVSNSIRENSIIVFVKNRKLYKKTLFPENKSDTKII